MTKYSTDSFYGTVDNKTVLDLEDDAAYVNMGAEWRMPTYDEQEELRNNCTWTWTTQSGTEGYRVTGPNGKSIFLPAAGSIDESGLSGTDPDGDGADSYGDYWSASLYWTSIYARDLYFKSSYHGTGYSRRCDGRTVRAVAR